MALIDKTTYIQNVQQIAMRLNMMWFGLSSSQQPLRRIEKQLILTSSSCDPNTSFIDEVFDKGKFPSTPNQMNSILNFIKPEALSSRILVINNTFDPAQNEAVVAIGELEPFFGTTWSNLDELGNDQTVELLALDGNDFIMFEESNPLNFVQFSSADLTITNQDDPPNITIYVNSILLNWSISEPLEGTILSIRLL